MLPAPVRMRSDEAFVRTRRHGGRAGNRYLVLHLAVEAVTDGDVPSREVGVVAGRPVGTAVVRNRVKRRLRHLLADRLDSLPMGTHLVVRALPPAAGLTSDALGRRLDGLLERVGATTHPAVDTAADGWKTS